MKNYLFYIISYFSSSNLTQVQKLIFISAIQMQLLLNNKDTLTNITYIVF